ncbi:MAG: RtcB family protein, partial [Actinomycetia bacterium]|nr:RtcB family protein [Actinomycetes bacterium]
GRIFADEALVTAAFNDKAIEQVANVACLPGIVEASFAMPDIHLGYGFPIGGVAATRVEGGVVSPGGVGFDISCGVRLIRTNIPSAEAKEQMGSLVNELAMNIPSGLGTKGRIALDDKQIDEVLKQGAGWCINQGYGEVEDLEFIEHHGAYETADPDRVSDHAKKRGQKQLGTLGSGNHFVEIQEVVEIYDQSAADAFGIKVGWLTVMIHSGSRGLGHQVCKDYLKVISEGNARSDLMSHDRQLACAPIESQTGRDYLAAMAAAANFGLANRQAIAHRVEQAFTTVFGASQKKLGLSLVYDVSHNVAQFEKHEVDGVPTELCVHRKGATRAFGPGQPEIPKAYRHIGQPVITPGDMGTASYLLVGTEKSMKRAFGSTCHGAGRVMSRKAAAKKMSGFSLMRELADQGVIVETGNRRTLSEEGPYAYKDIGRVVDICEAVGLSKKVAKLRPLGVVKG